MKDERGVKLLSLLFFYFCVSPQQLKFALEREDGYTTTWHKALNTGEGDADDAGGGGIASLLRESGLLRRCRFSMHVRAFAQNALHSRRRLERGGVGGSYSKCVFQEPSKAITQRRSNYITTNANCTCEEVTHPPPPPFVSNISLSRSPRPILQSAIVDDRFSE